MKATKRLSQSQRRRHSAHRHNSDRLSGDKRKNRATPSRVDIVTRKRVQRNNSRHKSTFDIWDLPFRRLGKNKFARMIEGMNAMLTLRTRDELRKMALEANIPGRSNMSKQQLVEALVAKATEDEAA